MRLSPIFRSASRPQARSLSELAGLGIGAGPERSSAIAKRIRLSNFFCLLAAAIGVASLPFDWMNAPRWMVAEDLVSVLVYVSLIACNRSGAHRFARNAMMVYSVAMMTLNSVMLGLSSGIYVVFFSLMVLPFALFDLEEERSSLIFSSLLATAGLVLSLVLESQNIPSPYFVYSIFMTCILLSFVGYQIVDENRRAEGALRESKMTAAYSAKMAALGEMSGGIAHEINNPLTAISLQAGRLRHLAQEQPISQATIAETAERIERTVQRISKIVSALRAFARDADKDPMTEVPLCQIIDDTCELCRERFRKHGVDLLIAPVPEDLTLTCRPVQLSQVLLNLLNNAFDAVETLGPKWVKLEVAKVGALISLSVTDSGPGIAQGLRDKIMQPFFTTKEVGRGTGLGLALARGIAQSHRGELTLDASCPNTRFVLTIPREG